MSATASARPKRDRLHIVSHFPGRLRVRAETFRVMPDVGDEVAARVADEKGVVTAERKAVTGSLLVTYDPRELQLPRLIALIIRVGGLHGLALDADDAWMHEPSQGARFRNGASVLNDALRGKSSGRLDLRTALPGALAGGGLLMLLAGKRAAPQWYDLLIWSVTTFSIFNPPSHGAPVANDDAEPPPDEEVAD